MRVNAEARCKNDQEALLAFGGWPEDTVQLMSDEGGGEAGTKIACIERQEQPQYPFQFYGGTSETATPTYLYFHSIIGGIRLRQEQSEPIQCIAGNEQYRLSVHSGECIPDLGYWLEPELQNALHTDLSITDLPGGETVYLASRTPLTEIRRQLRELENRIWLSPKSARVEIMLTTYNAHSDLFTATYVKI